MEKLKLYSIQNNLLSETLTNWNLLFLETYKILKNFLMEASKWHNFDYLEEESYFEYLPSDCYSELLFTVISLWFPFYYDLCKGSRWQIENDVKEFLDEIKVKN